jgi:hypothetical protein
MPAPPQRGTVGAFWRSGATGHRVGERRIQRPPTGDFRHGFQCHNLVKYRAGALFEFGQIRSGPGSAEGVRSPRRRNTPAANGAGVDHCGGRGADNGERLA